LNATRSSTNLHVALQAAFLHSGVYLARLGSSRLLTVGAAKSEDFPNTMRVFQNYQEVPAHDEVALS
jgi:hypothetical protein